MEDRQAALHHGSQGQVMGALLPSSHTLAHSQEDPVLTDGCGLRGPFSPRGSIPGLVLGGPPPQQRQAAAAGAMGSRVLVQLRRAAASHPGPLLLRGSEGEKGEGGRGEEERRRGRGAAGGREEGKC